MGVATAPKVSVVVATYNKPRELALCLEGYKYQNYLTGKGGPFHLIIADDGSEPETEETTVKFAKESALPVTFIRQEHHGWGKLRMMNWGFFEVIGEIVIFADGDCIPHQHFVEGHVESASAGVISCGRRVDMRKDLSSRITREDVMKGIVGNYRWLFKNIREGQLKYSEKGFYLPKPLGKLANSFAKHQRPTLLGSNFSMRKQDLVDLNGFDESFGTAGFGEDTDLERRALLAGMSLQWVLYRAIQYHLWHNPTLVGETTIGTYNALKDKGCTTAEAGFKELPREIRALSKNGQ